MKKILHLERRVEMGKKNLSAVRKKLFMLEAALELHEEE